MKPLLFYCSLLLLILTSCTTYQYTTISSTQARHETQGFVIENDSVSVIYQFDGLNTPIKIIIENKLTVPLYVDWKRSAVIINNESESYWRNNQKVSLQQNGYQLQWTPYLTTAQGEVTGEISTPESITFIPPGSRKTTCYVSLTPHYYKLPSGTKYRQTVKTNQGMTTTVVGHDYEEAISPMGFRSYLTLDDNPDFSSPITLQQSFWISKVEQTLTKPTHFLSGEKDKSYRYKKEEQNGVLLALITIGLLGAAAAAQ